MFRKERWSDASSSAFFFAQMFKQNFNVNKSKNFIHLSAKVVWMLTLHSVILNLFTWLSFLFPQDNSWNPVATSVEHEEVVTTPHVNNQAIVESIYYVNHLIDNPQTSKPPFSSASGIVPNTAAIAYGPKMLYFHIGNALELDFTSTSIIFPFHCFT